MTWFIGQIGSSSHALCQNKEWVPSPGWQQGVSVPALGWQQGVYKNDRGRDAWHRLKGVFSPHNLSGLSWLVAGGGAYWALNQFKQEKLVKRLFENIWRHSNQGSTAWYALSIWGKINQLNLCICQFNLEASVFIILLTVNRCGQTNFPMAV